MHREAIKLRTNALGPLFVRLAMMGVPCSLGFYPDTDKYMVAIVPDIEQDSPEDAGLLMAAMVGHKDVHFVKTDEGELLIVHKEDE